MRKFLTLTTVVSTLAFIVSADSAEFKGFYLGGQVGLVMSKAKAEAVLTNAQAATFNNMGVSTNSRKNSTGLLFGTYFGYGCNVSGFYIGGEVSILGDFAKRKTDPLNYTDPSNVSRSNPVEYERGIIFGLAPRLGYVFGDNLVYIKPGFEVSRDKVTLSPSAITATGVSTNYPKLSKSKTAAVFAPALGYEKAFGRMLFRVEYTYNAGKKLAIASNAVDVARISYSDNRFILGLSYRF